MNSNDVWRWIVVDHLYKNRALIRYGVVAIECTTAYNMNGIASDSVSSLGSEYGQPETAQEPVTKPDDQQILEQFEEYIVSVL